MSEEVFEPSSSDQVPAAGADDTQPIALPSVRPPVYEPPTATYALGALAGNPHLGSGVGSEAGSAPAADPEPAPGSTAPPPPLAAPPISPPPPPPPPPPPGYGAWTGAGGQPPMGGPPPAPPGGSSSGVGRSGLLRGLTAGTAALVLLGGGVGIGYAAWKSPTQLSNTPSANRAPGYLNPFGGNSQSPFGSGNNGGNFGGNGSNQGGGSSVGAGPSDAASIASKVDPGLVDINTSLGYQSVQEAGTGIVLTSSGEILTNNHVISGATTISVTDVGNHKTYSAKVVGYDRTKDIAVLQLQGASGLATANVGNSSNLSVGQQVVGVGNAGGTGGTPSYAGGTVTALNQSITATDTGNGSSEQLTGLIQTNANIQPGDSGGALVNTSGDVVGIDTAASGGFSFQTPDGSSSGEGFAIPIGTAMNLARQIEAKNASSTVHIGETAFLGVEIETQSAANGGPFGQGSGQGSGSSSGSGAVVAGVVTSSPAQEAGLAQGDVITSVDGTTINSPEDVTNALEQKHPGDKVTIAWTDTSGNSTQATVTLTSGPPQ